MATDKPAEKPTLEEVLKYAEKNIEIYIVKHAADIPREQKDEIRQEANLRIVAAYPRLNPDLGWKRFVQMHCSGAVQDFIRWGNGFEETNKSLREEASMELLQEPEQEKRADALLAAESGEESAETESADEPVKKPWRLRFRVNPIDEDGAPLDIEEVAGIYGIFVDTSGNRSRIRPRWDLIARMARVDEDIHLIAKLLLGFTQTELEPAFDVSRERLGQRIREFLERLDSPAHIHSPWVKQTIYAFGLSELYNEPEIDQLVGWDLEPIDLDAMTPVSQYDPQMGLFSQKESN